MTEKITPTTGWGFPTLTARKAHYFSDGRSLCGKYGCFGVELTPHTGTTSPDDCAACTRKLTYRDQTEDTAR